jgi:hypothetical protein
VVSIQIALFTTTLEKPLAILGEHLRYSKSQARLESVWSGHISNDKYGDLGEPAM